MYFKQIELTGFKSFADRTLVGLEEGMTAIVGPNGCGKSNILDAVRWALGEQSAKALRGSHMQDVIFNGSDDRAPTGLAEVTLTFDNSSGMLPMDFSEVQITRRVYRSGDSEYLINKAPCRLRDIQELFMDTGIGTNAYSMIGQGKIGMVLSSKPEERRYLFEEAAGIIKYKNRKRIAMRKLDQADQNLLRLSDIIAEVERQMRSLKRQVNAAIRYRELSDRLEELEIRAAWLKQVELSAKIEKLKRDFHEAQQSYEKENAELAKQEARFEELNLQKLEIDRVLHARREGVHEIDTEMERIERQLALLRQQIAFSGEQQERAAGEREAFENSAAQSLRMREEVIAKAEAVKAELDSLRVALDEKRAAHETGVAAVSAAESNLEDIRRRSVETLSVKARTQSQIDTLNASIDGTESQLKSIYDRQEENRVRRDELLASLADTRNAESTQQEQLADLASSQQETRRQIESSRERIDDLTEQRQAAREALGRDEARLTSLCELRDSYEGYAAGVRAVMTARQEGQLSAPGIRGPIGDLISVAPEHERAIESALGDRVNSIVVDSSEAAQRAIGFLNETKRGRVTFIPLDALRGAAQSDISVVSQHAGYVGEAIACVRFDASLEKAVRLVLQNTCIVDTLQNALRIARECEHCPNLVTLSGEFVAASGAITGGNTEHETGGLIGRQDEIAALEARVDAARETLERLVQDQETEAGRLTELESEATRLNTRETEIVNALRELGVAAAKHSTELDNLTHADDVLKTERERLSAAREQLENERREALGRAEDLDTEEERLQHAVAEAQDEASRARHEQSLLSDALSDTRLELAQRAQSLEEIEREAKRYMSDHENALGERDRRDEIIRELQENQAKLDHEVKDYIERSKALAESRDDARKNVVAAENDRQRILDESESIEKSLKEIRERAREAQTKVHQFELELRHDEDQLNFFQERILTEYNVALSMLSEEAVGTDDYDDETRERLVRETRTKLERMGSVNLMAIEEYEALTERHEFLTTQYTDLTSARDALLGVIQRIDATIKDMFLQTFQAVAENFRQYFRQLFSGGHARIYLIDEDDPLESGIEIEARPPGKKPQTISLLSGGEQAMTAIALLFSIFKAKPSPFCVLDEVDAPLDDANIGRFLKLTDEFAADTQYIVITHNKQTMARAGALYGVTQQERGVSQIVAVKLDEAPVEPAA